MTFVCKYVALYVPDLRAAESFYHEAFAMDLLFRESEREDGTWHTLRANLDWDDFDAHGSQCTWSRSDAMPSCWRSSTVPRRAGPSSS